MTPTRRAGLAVALTISVLALAACGGGTATSTPDAAATPTPAGDTPAPTTAPGESTPTATSEGVIPTFDLSGLVTNLDGVDSYRIAITSDGAAVYTATVVTKPVLSRDVTTDDGTRIVVIGDEAWIGQGDTLTPAPAEMATPMLAAFDPVLLLGAFASPGAMIGATEVGTEEKNGVQARRYRVDANSMVGAMASMPPGSAIEMWIADAGYLVSLSVSGVGERAFTMDVTNVNDPSNVVERPS